MSRKAARKPYWQMTTDELREATQQFDEEFVADKATQPTPAPYLYNASSLIATWSIPLRFVIQTR